MMKFQMTIGTAVALTALPAALAGCQKQAGPAETAGKKIDQAVEKSAEKIDQAVEKTGEKIEEAKEKVGETLEKADAKLKDATRSDEKK